MAWLALDVGGANLKSADGRGFAASRPFAIWKAPGELAGELAELIAVGPSCDAIAATMTGELADCFETKSEGVRAIVDALATVAGRRPLAIYTTDGEFVSPAAAREQPLAAAASNWHALAAYCSRLTHGRPGLLIDVGSTTVDVIPLGKDGPATTGRCDPQRLLLGELIYTGVERTPVSAIVRTLPWRGDDYPIASELFATAADAYVMLGEAPEEPQNHDSADGRPRTKAAARARLARMICADSGTFTEGDALSAAAVVREAQLSTLAAAASRVLARMPAQPRTIILSGHGEFLGAALVSRFVWGETRPEVLSLNKALGPRVSRCAPAHALAVLADERLGGAAAR
jgi:probable H4MPT-linked C1 transfer pathway protein